MLIYLAAILSLLMPMGQSHIIIERSPNIESPEEKDRDALSVHAIRSYLVHLLIIQCSCSCAEISAHDPIKNMHT